MAESTKRAIGKPPTPEQTERIKQACATTRIETAAVSYTHLTLPTSDLV